MVQRSQDMTNSSQDLTNSVSNMGGRPPPPPFGAIPEYRQPIHQSSDQSNSGRKEKVKPPCGEETEGQEGITNQADGLWFNPIKKRSIKGRTPDARAIFQAGTNKTSIQFE